jgi:hypothetical protein
MMIMIKGQDGDEWSELYAVINGTLLIIKQLKDVFEVEIMKFMIA